MTAPTPNDTTARTADSAQRLVDLIIHQDGVVQRWLQLLVTVEAGLAVGLGFVLRPATDGGLLQGAVFRVGATIIPSLGILLAVALTVLVVRERKWSSWYRQQLHQLTHDDGVQIAPQPVRCSDTVRGQRIGFTSRLVILMTVAISVGWLWVAIALLTGAA